MVRSKDEGMNKESRFPGRQSVKCVCLLDSNTSNTVFRANFCKNSTSLGTVHFVLIRRLFRDETSPWNAALGPLVRLTYLFASDTSKWVYRAPSLNLYLLHTPTAVPFDQSLDLAFDTRRIAFSLSLSCGGTSDMLRALKRCFHNSATPRNCLWIKFWHRVLLGSILASFTLLNVASKNHWCSHKLLSLWLSTNWAAWVFWSLILSFNRTLDNHNSILVVYRKHQLYTCNTDLFPLNLRCQSQACVFCEPTVTVAIVNWYEFCKVYFARIWFCLLVYVPVF